MRKFDTGATRDDDNQKIDFEGHLNPAVLELYGEYMHKCRQQEGTLRDSDDWQRGIPKEVYAKSLIRHCFQFWKIHRGGIVFDKKDGHIIDIKDALCGILFNTMGYLLELIKEE